MNKKRISLLASTGLFALWCVFWSQMSTVSTALQLPGSEKTGQKSDPILLKIESALQKEKPGTLIIADKDGKIVDKFDVKDLRLEGFKSLADYANKKAKSDECNRISTRCVRCPDGKIYCTNDSKF